MLRCRSRVCKSVTSPIVSAAGALRGRHLRSFSNSRAVKRIIGVVKLTKLEEIRRGLASPEVARINNASEACLKSDKEHFDCVRVVKAVLAAKAAKDKELEVRFTETLRDADSEWADLILSIGGDGTFLRAARHISEQSQAAILGVNSSPSSSFGFFSAANATTFPSLLDAVLAAQMPVTPLWRMKVLIDGVPLPTLVLNEALFAPDCPAVTARYIVRNAAVSQGQHSSGIWVSTAAGSTGAIFSAGGQALPLHQRALQFRVRELFPLMLRGAQPLQGGILADDFSILSRTIGGALYLDGRYTPIVVPFGARLTFQSSDMPLRWIAPLNQDHIVSDNFQLLTGRPRPLSTSSSSASA